MSDIIKQAYDEMGLEEVICRLPSEFAIDSLKRRLDDVDKLKKFFKTRDAGGASKCDEIKKHVNEIISLSTVDDIFQTFTPEYHPTLFGWLDNKNKTRLLTEGKDKLTIEFIFNLTDKKDLNGIQYILERVLSETNPDIPKIVAILNKIHKEHFPILMEMIVRDKRPNIRSSILSVYEKPNIDLISDHQKMIALKAFAKIPSSEKSFGYIRPINFKLFQDLKPLERIMALDRYLNYFPKHRKTKVFDPEPTEEELNSILFAGCFQFNDVVEDIVKKYNAITKDEKQDESTN